MNGTIAGRTIGLCAAAVVLPFLSVVICGCFCFNIISLIGKVLWYLEAALLCTSLTLGLLICCCGCFCFYFPQPTPVEVQEALKVVKCSEVTAVQFLPVDTEDYVEKLVFRTIGVVCGMGLPKKPRRKREPRDTDTCALCVAKFEVRKVERTQ